MGTATDRALDRSVQRLGSRIRELRKARNMTIVQLAEASDLSHPFISQLERGLARPSMSSLFRIAQTLGTSQQSLLADSVAPDDPPVGPPVAGVVVRRNDDATALAAGGSVHALVPGAERPFIPLEYRGDSTDLLEYWEHAEDEFVYVVSGRVRLDVDGVLHELDECDSAYLDGGVPHRWASADGRPFRLLVVKEGESRAGH